VSGVDHPNQSLAARVEIVLDSGGLVLSVSSAKEAQRLVSEVQKGASLQSLIHSDDYDSFLWSAKGVLNGDHRRQTIQLRWARPNGRWAKVNVALTRMSDQTVLLIFHPDEIEQARRAEAQFRLIVEGGSADGIVVRNTKQVLYQNDAFAHMLGYASTREMARVAEAETRAGGNLNSSGATHPDDRALVAEHMRRRIAGEETVSSFEFRLLRRDGAVVWVHTRATLVNWNGEPALLSWLSDITKRKAIEAENIRSKESAETANRAKTAFLATISHELRTPLNAIIGFAEVIKDEIFGPVGLRKYAEYARDIHGSGRHLLDLINDILDLSKLESGMLELREEIVDLGGLVDECVGIVRDRAQKSQIMVATKVEPRLPRLACDERAIKQVLLNFLSNAIKFTLAGGSVTTGANHGPDGVAIWVRDTGIGMSEADVKIALVAFRQIDSTISRKYQGAGLGLSISKSLIELHGGTLAVESTPGLGTTMTAIFPVSRIEACAPQTGASSSG
jgi:PAS domain S-box-containing protein